MTHTPGQRTTMATNQRVTNRPDHRGQQIPTIVQAPPQAHLDTFTPWKGRELQAQGTLPAGGPIYSDMPIDRFVPIIPEGNTPACAQRLQYGNTTNDAKRQPLQVGGHAKTTKGAHKTGYRSMISRKDKYMAEVTCSRRMNRYTQKGEDTTVCSPHL